MLCCVFFNISIKYEAQYYYFLKRIVLKNNTVESAMNSHPWATGKVTIQDRWLLIGGSFSGGSRSTPPRLWYQKTKNAHIWAEICCRMHHLKPWVSLEHLKRWVCINYCKISLPGFATVILIQNVILWCGQAGYPAWPGRLTSPVALTALLNPQPAVDNRHSYRLPKNSDAMELKQIFKMPIKTWAFSAGVDLWSFWTNTYKNGGLCVRALRCHQGSSGLAPHNSGCSFYYIGLYREWYAMHVFFDVFK